ncbi:5-hydroxytryptamine 2 receptor [Culex quinquefasciatus]|uniref:5-hydroxytryptamine 2 receptor n=1 Tax=Culex quinquefasciatus TaxID=7176 RepID=B0X0U9_CULQU|nr:5-hydroxytryptamine 2 receptor [Culex quinquefasciatus]|eukprot:XP_001863271.1 5-hydroxytryptamine 2 receptor [Culex quinquefasciatus]
MIDSRDWHALAGPGSKPSAPDLQAVCYRATRPSASDVFSSTKQSSTPAAVPPPSRPLVPKKRRSSTSAWINRRNSVTPPSTTARKRFKSLPFVVPPPGDSAGDVTVDDLLLQKRIRAVEAVLYHGITCNTVERLDNQKALLEPGLALLHGPSSRICVKCSDLQTGIVRKVRIFVVLQPVIL